MQASKTHWASILILIAMGMGSLVFLTSSLATGITSIIYLFDDTADPAGLMIRSFATGFELIILLICAWFVLQKAMQKDEADRPMQLSFQTWLAFAIPILVLACIGVGAAIAFSEVKWLGWLTLPTLTLPVILLPILFFFRMGTQGIGLASRWEVAGVLGLGMTVGPFLMIFLEIITLAFLVLVAVFSISAQPELVTELARLADLINAGMSEEAIVELLAPYLTQPLVITGVLVYLAFIVPLIEELLKPLGVWLFAKGIDSPASGFALGMLSGGVFALIESLNASGDGSLGWPAIVSVRAGTSLLHMATSGLMGYAIVRLFREKRPGPMLVTYLACVALHGLWNASAVFVGLGSIGEMLGKPEWLWQFVPAGALGIAVLGLGMLFVLIAANRKLRSPAPQEVATSEKG